MEIRVLQYFLTVAREENVTRAAEILHITQPTLSRQLAQMEEEIGVKLFARTTRKITLTNEGILLRRRAEEILQLVDKTEKELTEQEESVEGTVAVGCGDLGTVQVLAELFQGFNRRYPAVKFEMYTATADYVKERMERGLIDVGLLLEPIDIEKYEFIRLKQTEQWVVSMWPDSPLARKKRITAKDLKDLPLILPWRLNVQSELANWFGKEFSGLNVLFTSNLPSNALAMVQHKLAYSININGSAIMMTDKNKITCRPLYPPISSRSLLAWKRQQPFGLAATKFIEYIKNNLN